LYIGYKELELAGGVGPGADTWDWPVWDSEFFRRQHSDYLTFADNFSVPEAIPVDYE
jgi:hypothetical protein